MVPTVLNTSNRARVGLGEDVTIAGFIVGEGIGRGDVRVLVRAIGPTLNTSGIIDPLQDPVLELHDSHGTVIASNDNWKDTQQAELQATGIPPNSDLESALVLNVLPGAYTAIVRGKNNATGIGIVEVYALP